MSYLYVAKSLPNYLLEDSHNRKYQKLKLTSSPTRNDLAPVKDGKKVQGNKNRKIKPNNLGEFEYKEDADKASESNATLRQNLDNEKINRIALRYKLPIAKKNPKNPGIHPGLYSTVENDNSTKPAYIKKIKEQDPNKKTPLDPKIKAASNTIRHTLYTNKNSTIQDTKINKKLSEKEQEAVKQHSALGKTKSENHEEDHIMDMVYVEKKHGKKAARNMEIKNRLASYNANQAEKDYSAKMDNPHLYHLNAIKQSKENLDNSREDYLHNPTEYNAHIVAANTKHPNDRNVVERLANPRYKIMDAGIKGKKIPDIDDETLKKAKNEQPMKK